MIEYEDIKWSNPLRISLEAHNTDRNVKRFYDIAIMPSLFSHHSVLISYGRIGQKPRYISYIASSLDEAINFIKPRLKKRLNAKKRIGCNYKFS